MNAARAVLSRSALFAYGIFGLPLALVALPIYVYVPQFYARQFGLSLSVIGTALLAARMLDAFIDPGFGAWIDRRPIQRGYGWFVALALPALALGFVALFHPPDAVRAAPLPWFVASLVLVYLGFSLATIAHQSWGAALSQQRGDRARLTGTREACGLVGVLLAAILTSMAGIGWLSAVFVATLAASATLLLRRAPQAPPTGPRAPVSLRTLTEPFRNGRFRWLFAVFVVNGIAAAIPATLFLFFATDRLQLGHDAGVFLVLYFAAAAVSMPLWIALAKQRGEAYAWRISMGVAIGAFAWVYALAPGAALSFGVICAVSGLALGADLALPPALLAAVIASAGHSGTREGAYFGAWSWATKMNLALAAGIALPLLQHLGYVPGTADVHGVAALGIAYAVLPCGLKLMAALLLWRAPLDAL